MNRTTQTPEEREARRRERSRHSFSDAAYGRYDPTGDGFGSPEQWEAAAGRLATGRTTYKRGRFAERPSDLDLLGLREMPIDIDGLQRAFRARAMTTHPDHGGNSEAFKAAYAAYERLVRHY